MSTDGIIKKHALSKWASIVNAGGDMRSVTPMVFMSTVILFLTANPYSNAQDNDGAAAIEQVSLVIDNKARKLGGTKMVAEHLKKQFHVDENTIYTLREKKMGYGDITTLLALAEQMPGGINEDNLNEIVDIRKGKWGDEGWERVAEYLGVEIDPVILRTKAVGSSLEHSADVSYEYASSEMAI